MILLQNFYRPQFPCVQSVFSDLIFWFKWRSWTRRTTSRSLTSRTRTTGSWPRKRRLCTRPASSWQCRWNRCWRWPSSAPWRIEPTASTCRRLSSVSSSRTRFRIQAKKRLRCNTTFFLILYWRQVCSSPYAAPLSPVNTN